MTWSNTDKAQWILQNGEPDVLWVYERVDNQVYRRPMTHVGNVPPWIPQEREPVYNLDTRGTINDKH